MVTRLGGMETSSYNDRKEKDVIKNRKHCSSLQGQRKEMVLSFPKLDTVHLEDIILGNADIYYYFKTSCIARSFIIMLRILLPLMLNGKNL